MAAEVVVVAVVVGVDGAGGAVCLVVGALAGALHWRPPTFLIWQVRVSVTGSNFAPVEDALRCRLDCDVGHAPAEKIQVYQ